MTGLTNEQRAAITAMSPSAYGYIKELEAMVATATERIAELEAIVKAANLKGKQP